jgi:hypothetical protein
MAAENEAHPFRPWEGTEYDWVAAKAADTQAWGHGFSGRRNAIEQQLLLPDADNIRDILSGLHAVPPGIDIDRAEHFIEALCGSTAPSIIIDSDMSEEGFMTVLNLLHIPWIKGTIGRYSYQLGANIIHFPQLQEDEKALVEETVVHENIHPKGFLVGNIWEEGFARLLEYVYARLIKPDSGLRDFKDLSPPYSVHDIGFIAVSNICDQNPDVFESMLQVKSSGGSGEAYSDFMERMHALIGARRFWHLNLAQAVLNNGGETELIQFDAPPAALQGIIPHNCFEEATVPIDNILPIVSANLARYEARTGYSFGFKGLHLGATGLQGVSLAGESPADSTKDPMIVAIQSAIDTMH